MMIGCSSSTQKIINLAQKEQELIKENRSALGQFTQQQQAALSSNYNRNDSIVVHSRDSFDQIIGSSSKGFKQQLSPCMPSESTISIKKPNMKTLDLLESRGENKSAYLNKMLHELSSKNHEQRLDEGSTRDQQQDLANMLIKSMEARKRAAAPEQQQESLRQKITLEMMGQMQNYLEWKNKFANKQSPITTANHQAIITGRNSNNIFVQKRTMVGSEAE